MAAKDTGAKGIELFILILTAFLFLSSESKYGGGIFQLLTIWKATLSICALLQHVSGAVRTVVVPHADMMIFFFIFLMANVCICACSRLLLSLCVIHCMK